MDGNTHIQTYNIQTYKHITYKHITYKHTNIQTYKHTNIQTYKHTNIQTSVGLNIDASSRSHNIYRSCSIDISRCIDGSHSLHKPCGIYGHL